MIEKTYKSRFYPLILCLIHLSLLGISVYIVDYFSKAEIKNILERWVPWNLRLNFLLISAGIVICHRDILGVFKEFMKKKGVFLLVLLLLAYSIVSFVVPRTHRIFYDEDIYANMGQNIAHNNRTGYCNYGTFEYGEFKSHWIGYNKEPSGWPFLLSVIFQLFGTNEIYAFILNNILFITGLLLVFFITWYLTGNYFTSYLSALVFALIPHNLIWANTAAAELSASVFAGVTALSLIVFLRTGSSRHLFLLVVLIPFACQMRPESILIFFWAIIAILVFSPKTLTSNRVWTFALLITLLLLPHLLHTYAVSGHSWGAKGIKFSHDFFWNNLRTNGLYYLNNEEFPVLHTLLLFIGLLFAQYTLRWKLLIFSWLLSFWGIFLFFYAGSYRYGADVRFSLLSFIPLAILAGMGGGFISDLLKRAGSKIQEAGSCLVILVLVYSFIQFLPLVRQVGQEAWGARYDHKYAKIFMQEIPARSIVLTHNPTMFLLWNRNAIQTYAGINNPRLIENLIKKYDGHVYFHYNYWCNTKTERNRRLCQAIEEKYRLKEIAKANERDYKYALYKMSLR